MKIIVFLCFALIASQHMAAAISRAEILALLQQDTTVDKVLQLFQNLQANTKTDRDNLEADYADWEPKLAASIVDFTNQLNTKLGQCADIDALIANGKDQAQRLEDNIKAAQDNIDSNNAKAQSAADARCAANLLFISELANKQEAVEFLTYLRGRVADPAFADYLRGSTGAFLQIKAALATKKDSEILTLLAKHHIISTLQKKSKQDYEGENDLEGELNVRVRSSDEVGDYHVDNTQGELQVQNINTDSLSVDDYVQLLLGYIDKLVAQLGSDESKLQAAETAAVQAFIEYQQQLKDQNYVLTQYIASATANLQSVQQTNKDNEAAAEQCRQEVVPLQENVAATQNNYNDRVQAYHDTHNRLDDGIALFEQVIELYQREVVNVASEEEKARADDYLDNQVFDNGSFNARTDFGA